MDMCVSMYMIFIHPRIFLEESITLEKEKKGIKVFFFFLLSALLYYYFFLVQKAFLL